MFKYRNMSLDAQVLALKVDLMIVGPSEDDPERTKLEELREQAEGATDDVKQSIVTFIPHFPYG